MRMFGGGLAALVLSAMLAVPASAAVIDVDFQTTDNPDNNTGLGIVSTNLGQTFTVGTTGLLSAISFNVLSDGATGDLGFSVRLADLTNGPDPDSDDSLFRTLIDIASIGTAGPSPLGWTTITVDLSAENIQVTAGDIMSFVLSAPLGEEFVVQTDYNNAYAEGSRWSSVVDGDPMSEFRGADLIFTTYVGELTPVPLPAALPMLLAALGGLGLMARRRSA